MAENNELKRIKKVYGENFMKLCRELFPGILEHEGRLTEILSIRFSRNCQTLYEDIVNNGLEGEFKGYIYNNYIYSNIDVESEEKRIILYKTPYELLDEAGYELIECNNEAEIQQFKKYYAQGEELCTFGGGRLNKNVVFFAVRKDVENIQRQNYDEPEREDEYSTSVLGIQFNKTGKCTAEIISRYNHTVDNPNATYGGDLNKITPGLELSFAQMLEERGIELDKKSKEQFKIPGYEFRDGKYYKYNQEIHAVYYCPGNIIIDGGNIIQLDKNQELVDYFIVDSKEKKVHLYKGAFITDSFIDDLQELEKVEISKDKENGNGSRKIVIRKNGKKEPIVINVDKNNEIIGYTNKDLKKIGYYFLYHNKKLSKLELPNLEQVGDDFLHKNENLTELELPNLKQVGDYFLYHNEKLTELELPNLKQVGDCVLADNKELSKLELPNLEQAGNCFLNDNKKLSELELPNLKQVGNCFFSNNEKLSKLELPNLEQVGDLFLYDNEKLTELELPNLQQVGERFLKNNKELKKLQMPKLKEKGEEFLGSHPIFSKLTLEQIQRLSIDSNDIAKLDKKSELTASEISQSSAEIDRMLDKENGKEER